MARGLSAAMLAAIAAGTVRPAFFYEGEFSTGVLRLWTGRGTFAWDGQSWLGAGEMLGVSPIMEGSAVRAVGFSVSMTGEATAERSAALTGVQQGLPGT